MRARRGGRFGITEGAGRERGGSVQRVSAESGGVWRFGWAGGWEACESGAEAPHSGDAGAGFRRGVGGARMGVENVTSSI